MSFYVYLLTDPRDGSTFYVGKGSGNRLSDHEREAARGVASPKCERIRDIWAEGQSVEREIIGRFERETDAYRAEERAIEFIGLHRLTNLAAGGRGGRRKRKAFKWSPEAAASIGPKLLRALWAIGHIGGLSASGVDVTAAILRLAKRLRADLGDDAYFVALGI